MTPTPKFTPGVWIAEPKPSGVRIWSSFKIRSGVADVCVRRSIDAVGEPSVEELANGALIAAAPDLFEALRDARTAVERFAVEEARSNLAPTGLKPSTKWRDRLKAVDEALARASRP